MGFYTSTMDFPLIFDEFSGNFFKISEHIFVTTKNIFAQTKQSENCFVSNEKNTGAGCLYHSALGVASLTHRSAKRIVFVFGR